MYIIGAGYTGLIAATIFPHATILEARPEPFETHQALLRFRTSHVGDLTHIPFEPVKVLKSIWFDGREVSPAPRFSNLYSKKVTGKYLSRSIDNIDPVTRYMAPTDFYDQLLAQVGDRIRWGFKVQSVTKDYISSAKAGELLPRENWPILSTIPLGHMARACSVGVSLDFSYQPISTYRAKIKTAERVFCTVYMPDPDLAVYRASITDNLLIVECTDHSTNILYDFDEMDWQVQLALGLSSADVDWEPSSHTQKYGKISPVDNRIRKQMIYTMTNRLGVFSLGRFGTWRNILLDDVYHDLMKVRKMITLDDYELKSLQL